MAFQFSFDAIGTKWVIDIYDDVPAEKAAGIEARVTECIRQFDERYSRFRADSWINAIASKPGTYDLPDDAFPLFSLYKEMYDISGGLVTPLIGQALVDAGYDSQYSFTQKKPLEEPPAWDEALVLSPASITILKPVHIDVGALGKGYLIDIVGALIAGMGVAGYCVDAGRDILHKDPSGKALEVGLEHPEDFSKVIGKAVLRSESIAGSAGNRRSWGAFTHIINPKTLSSPTDILALWAIADTALLADALSTALFFVPAAALAEKYKFRYVILHSDHSAEWSQGPGDMIELYA